MEYDFYQNMKYIGKLVKVGKGFVPNNEPVWRYAVPEEPRIGNVDELFTSPPRQKIHDYCRRKTITGTIYVAEV